MNCRQSVENKTLLKMFTRKNHRSSSDDLYRCGTHYGAFTIYLRNADTQFSLKDDENNLNAEIKKTGIYLKESTGSVGTLNHVDLAI